MSADRVSFVRTVLGDITPPSLGPCYAHEHVVIDDCYATRTHPEYLLNDLDKIVAELQAFHAAGGRAMVDAMPAEAGRNLRMLKEVSHRTGVHIVAPTGLHLPMYYPPGHWSTQPDFDECVRRFGDDIRHKQCGVIKIASSLDGLTDREKVIFGAAAMVHVETGCPILTHTEKGTAAFEQIKVLTDFDADPAHIVLSHTDRKPDLQYHRDILSTGVKVEYDSAFRWRVPPNFTLDLVLKLIDEFPNQIMLGMDAARSAYWQSYGGRPGLTYLLTTFSDTLRKRGLSEEHRRRIFVTTPANTFAFARRN